VLDIQSTPFDQPLKIIIGAGEQRYDGWIATQKEDLDLVDPAMWAQIFGERQVDAFLCEHVWEHLTEEEGYLAAELCYHYLKPGGYLRCAVPDGYFPNEAYQRVIQVGGPGSVDHPAADHKIVYTYERFCAVFTAAGFEVDLLEYCDANGRFHYNHWNPQAGMIYRSLRFDHRNRHGELNSVSLLLDAIKPKS